MARLVLVNLDLGSNQILNVLAQIIAGDPGTPAEGQFWYNSTLDALSFRAAGVTHRLGTLDQISAPAADVAMATHKITGLGEPTAAQDAATKAYVDTFVNGLNWKDAVRVATAAPGTLATDFDDGSTIDGVAVATGDRILIKDQAAGAENGIYVVAASGAPARATDADTAADILSAAMFVVEGTANADTAWILTTNPITLGTTALVFAQFGAGASYTAGDGIDVTGTVISLDVPVAIAHGGTNATTEAGAKTTLGFMTRFAANVGDTAASAFNIDHNLGTLDVHVAVFRNSDGAEVIADVVRSTTNRVIVTFAVAPATDAYRVVVIG